MYKSDRPQFAPPRPSSASARQSTPCPRRTSPRMPQRPSLLVRRCLTASSTAPRGAAKKAAPRPIGPEAAENSVRAGARNRGAALRTRSVCQLPPECPLDMECPIEPKPPREVEGAERVDVVLVPLRLDVSAVETEVGARPMEEKPCRFTLERELQPQLPHEREERRRHGCSWAAFCGSAAGGL